MLDVLFSVSLLACTEILDLVFVLDSSGSINEKDTSNWQRMKEFVSSVINILSVGANAVRVGLVLYSTSATNRFYLNTYMDKADVLRTVRSLPYLDNGTNTALGLQLMRQDQFVRARGDRRMAPNVAIVITDGASTVNPELTIPRAIQARREDINIVSIGITDKVNLTELRLISSEPQVENRNWFRTADFQLLSSIVRNVGNSVCPTVPPVGE